MDTSGSRSALWAAVERRLGHRDGGTCCTPPIARVVQQHSARPPPLSLIPSHPVHITTHILVLYTQHYSRTSALKMDAMPPHVYRGVHLRHGWRCISYCGMWIVDDNFQSQSQSQCRSNMSREWCQSATVSDATAMLRWGRVTRQSRVRFAFLRALSFRL